MDVRLDQPAAAQAALGVVGRRVADEVRLDRRDAAVLEADVGQRIVAAGDTRVADHEIDHAEDSRCARGMKGRDDLVGIR